MPSTTFILAVWTGKLHDDVWVFSFLKDGLRGETVIPFRWRFQVRWSVGRQKRACFENWSDSNIPYTMVKYVPVSWGVCYLPLSTYSFLSSRRCLSPFNAWEIVLAGSRFQKEQLNQSLPSSKLTWQWNITILIGDTSSKGPFSIVMLVYRSVFYPGFLPMFDNPNKTLSAIYHPTSFLRPTGSSIPEMFVPDSWVFVKYQGFYQTNHLRSQTNPSCFVQVSLTNCPKLSFTRPLGMAAWGWPVPAFPHGRNFRSGTSSPHAWSHFHLGTDSGFTFSSSCATRSCEARHE